jgi:hypothetical protein
MKNGRSNFGIKRTKIISSSLETILPKVLIYIIYGYDFNFQVKLKTYFLLLYVPPLVIYNKKVYFVSQGDGCCRLIDEKFKVHFSFEKEPENSITHDGWRHLNDHSWCEKFKVF